MIVARKPVRRCKVSIKCTANSISTAYKIKFPVCCFLERSSYFSSMKFIVKNQHRAKTKQLPCFDYESTGSVARKSCKVCSSVRIEISSANNERLSVEKAKRKRRRASQFGQLRRKSSSCAQSICDVFFFLANGFASAPILNFKLSTDSSANCATTKRR